MKAENNTDLALKENSGKKREHEGGQGAAKWKAKIYKTEEPETKIIIPKQQKKQSSLADLEGFDKTKYEDVRLKSIEKYLFTCACGPDDDDERNNPESKRYRPNIRYYQAPWRDEKKASLKVDLSRNEWYDFGEGVGGGIIKLVMRIDNLPAERAIEYLKGEKFSDTPYISIQKGDPDKLRVVKVSSFTSCYPLKKYLESRGITVKLAQHYLKKVEFYINGKGIQQGTDPIYSLGMQTSIGSWEVNNRKGGSIFKAIIGKKHISFYPGRYAEKKVLNIFEGFFDFLSFIELEKQAKKNTELINPKYDCVILHGVNQIKLLNESVNLEAYQQLNSFLDNDKAGETALNYLLSKHRKVVNYSKMVYPTYKDLNEYFVEEVMKGFCKYKNYNLPASEKDSNFKMYVVWKDFYKAPGQAYGRNIWSIDPIEERNRAPKKGLSMAAGMRNYEGLRNLVAFGEKVLKQGKAIAATIYLNKIVNDEDDQKRPGLEIPGGRLHEHFRQATS